MKWVLLFGLGVGALQSDGLLGLAGLVWDVPAIDRMDQA